MRSQNKPFHLSASTPRRSFSTSNGTATVSKRAREGSRNNMEMFDKKTLVFRREMSKKKLLLLTNLLKVTIYLNSLCNRIISVRNKRVTKGDVM